MGVGKTVGISIVSLILVVGAVIGVVVVVRSTNNSSSDNNHPSNNQEQQPFSASTTTKAVVETICAPTSYKDICTRSLQPVAQNATATPKDYIMAIIEATLEEVKKSFEVTGKTIVNKNADPYNDHMAVEDCKELLDQAIDRLQVSYSSVSNSEMHTLHDRADEWRSWMTSIYALQSICKDQITNQEYKFDIENGMVNATQLTHNTIDILAELPEAFKGFNIPFDVKPSARRLMGVNSYPSWVRPVDRRLLRAGGGHIKPNFVVAKDNSGDFTKVLDAINAYPKNNKGRFIIYVKEGLYDEIVNIDKDKKNILIYGDGPGKTIITGSLNYGIRKIPTMNTATFSNDADGFIARGITFRNTAGPEGHQAVALRINGNYSVVYNCHMEGYQDTLYYQTATQFYRNCVISGTVDFIFGMGEAVIQNSTIIVRKPIAGQPNTITSDGREVERAKSGLVLQKCRIIADKELLEAYVKDNITSYLGRPWKKDALTVVMQSDIDGFISSIGWSRWNDTVHYTSASQYFEYANRGPGADTTKRNKEFKNFKVLSQEEEARPYTPRQFLRGDETWLKQDHIPRDLDF